MSNSHFKSNIDLYDHADQVKFYSEFRGLVPAESHLLNKWFAPSRVLDLGCGSGRTSVELKQLGHDVVAIDLSDSLLQIAKERYPNIRFLNMDASALTFDAESFDNVLFSFNGIDCLYPQSLRDKVIDEAHRVLKKNGIFYYSSHSAPGYLSREWARGRVAYKKILRFARAQNVTRALRGFWNFKEGDQDNILFARSARKNVQALDPKKWKVEESLGSSHYRDENFQVLFDGTTWMTPYDLPHNHFIVRKV